MAHGNMFGVVLWSDADYRKAVIWCEDHGDLAYFKADEQSVWDGPDLDAGDLVQFEVDPDAQTRLASNPRLVAEQEYPSLAHALKPSETARPQLRAVDNTADIRLLPKAAPAMRDTEYHSAEVISFDATMKRRTRGPAPL